MLYRFDCYELDTDLHEFRADGEVRALEPQVFDLLSHLVQNHDRLVDRDELIAIVWQGRIVSDSSVDARVHAARRAVDDNGRQQARIKTVPRRGYRFISDVVAVSGRDVPVSSVVIDEPANELAAIDRPTIAVLPFANQSETQDHPYFADGITDDIITALSKFRWFFVCARESTFTLRDDPINVKQVGRELSVRYLLQGSMRRIDRRVRVHARLIDTTSSACIWTDSFDREREDLFELQDEIARTVVGAIEPEMGSAERARAQKRPERDLYAWERSQRGFWHLWRLTDKDIELGELHFQAAIEIDPELGSAYTGLAMVLVSKIMHGWSKSKATLLARAESLTKTAISLDERDALAFAVLGRIQTLMWDFEAATGNLREALELNPNSTYALNSMGIALFWSGRAVEAVEFFQRAIQQSPRDPARWVFELHMGFCHYSQHEPIEAIAWFEKAGRHPTANFWPNIGIAMVYASTDQPTKAEMAVAAARKLEPGLSLRQISPMLEKPEGLISIELLRRSGLPEN